MSVIAGFSVKKFAIVGFIEEENVIEVIPSSWILNASEAKWPTKFSPVILAKYIKQCKPVEKEWKTLKIKIYGFSKTFKSAKYKADLAQDTSNLESDSSFDDNILLKHRKRKRPARYQTTDTSASENESSFKKDDSVAQKLRKKVDSTHSDGLLKQRKRKKPARYEPSDASASENESNTKKENCDAPKLREKSDSSYNDSLHVKQRRRKRPARYQSTDTSASENESIVKKYNCGVSKIIKNALIKGKSKSNISNNTSEFDVSISKDSHTKESERKKPFPIHSKEEFLNKRESLKEKKKHISSESNKASSSVSLSPTLFDNESWKTFSSEPLISQSFQNTLNEVESVGILSQMLQYMKQIHGELKDLNSKCDNMSWQLTRLTKSTDDLNLVNNFSPIDIDLPVTSVDMLTNLNNKLRRDKEFFEGLVYYLRAYGNGNSINLFLLSIAKKILSPELAINFTTCGRRGKTSLMNFSEIINAIFTSTLLKFRESKRESLILMFDKHLITAKDWLGK